MFTGYQGEDILKKNGGCVPVVIPADIINAGAVRSAVCADYGHACDNKKKAAVQKAAFFPLNFSSCATSGYIAKRSDKELTTVGHLANGKRVAAFPLSLLPLLYSSTRQRSHTLACAATLTTFSSHLPSWSHRKLGKETLASSPPHHSLLISSLIGCWITPSPSRPQFCQDVVSTARLSVP